ncbi:MAG: Hpt domain-containing protein [Burkholderiales bacterium]
MTAEEFRRHLEAMRADYRDHLPEKISALGRLWRDAMNGTLPATALNELCRELHTLAGSASTFGVAHVGELASAAESLLDPFCARGVTPDATSAAELTALLDALQRAVGRS